jgi:hypothetical protein
MTSLGPRAPKCCPTTAPGPWQTRAPNHVRYMLGACSSPFPLFALFEASEDGAWDRTHSALLMPGAIPSWMHWHMEG